MGIPKHFQKSQFWNRIFKNLIFKNLNFESVGKSHFENLKFESGADVFPKISILESTFSVSRKSHFQFLVGSFPKISNPNP